MSKIVSNNIFLLYWLVSLLAYNVWTLFFPDNINIYPFFKHYPGMTWIIIYGFQRSETPRVLYWAIYLFFLDSIPRSSCFKDIHIQVMRSFMRYNDIFKLRFCWTLKTQSMLLSCTFWLMETTFSFISVFHIFISLSNNSHVLRLRRRQTTAFD